MNPLLTGMNDKQAEAVQTTEGPLLIMAGAGAGKTRVLTHRIAYLIDEKMINPWNILAITFTNKAAREMRERAMALNPATSETLIATFHCMCVRILRREADHIGYNRNFTIVDPGEQRTLMKRILKNLNLDPKKWNERAILGTISNAKNDLLDEVAYEHQAGDMYTQIVAKCYKAYQEELRRSEAMDFDDLIMMTLRLFDKNPDVLAYYQQRYQYIHVDEYQDTNGVQYAITNLLASKYKNLMVVGDDDQSIYGWRGADIRNILEFEKDYDDVFVVKLEQNYRSTQVILDAANHVISNNIERKRKKLWSEKTEGEKIKIELAENELEEGRFIAETIIDKVQGEGRKYSDCAVLYRANAQARPIEDALNRAGVPYNIYGGTKFYERKEIKDLIAYLRIIANPQDDISLKRIINVPRRGIGLRTIEKIEDRASLKQESMYSVLLDIDSNSEISTKAKKQINGFVDLVGTLRAIKEVYPVSKLIEKVLDSTGYIYELEEEMKKNQNSMNGKYEEAQDRIDNLNEFISIALEFENSDDENLEDKSLETFLTSVALTSEATEDEEPNRVSLMTMHTSKGLEFPVVFITGMEEGLFPISRAIKSMKDSDIEEERRLCYVGITRAREELYLTMTEKRTLYGKTNHAIQSRFIEELPDECIEKLYMG